MLRLRGVGFPLGFGLGLGPGFGLSFRRLRTLLLLAAWPSFNLGSQVANGIVNSLSLDFQSSDRHFCEGSIHDVYNTQRARWRPA